MQYWLEIRLSAVASVEFNAYLDRGHQFPSGIVRSVKPMYRQAASYIDRNLASPRAMIAYRRIDE